MQYLIEGETLTQIADATRLMTGNTQKMTPSEIIYWLGKVVYLPQGRASTTVDIGQLNYSSTAVGVLPVVVQGAASSSIDVSALVLTSSAVGQL